ncbi:50S ribosomal protein L6 [Mycoplasma sp. Mirounga ES2805-ORL]|uniref:50S ribosomal protein L6 n=1 Tax=Mycoplasma sp. Mirounga ES2805-ORL TaxID=754514 RepID=UPI00197B8F9D|nr:50S ribosomal protein L6 [Mycoplasma sp. Mirounga ES2805-ORL]QSF13950.1 50S ribosomal protein L6 [Mycoplasma sp. Mirounga ES2805-ORL]
MSRVGNRILTIPTGVEVKQEGLVFTVKGPLGELKREFSPLIAINVQGSEITTIRANEEKATKQLHGTTNALISNMLKGVSKGFKKELVIKGVGYKATLKGNILEIAAGYSHLVNLEIPNGVKVEVPKATEVSVSGINKEDVGQFAALVHDVRKPNPYSGKGIAYVGEYIRRKEGKTAAK